MSRIGLSHPERDGGTGAPLPAARRAFLLTAGRLSIATVALGLQIRAEAQTPWPAKPVRIVVPYSVGLGPDVVAREVAKFMSRVWKQPVVVENKPGASGIVALSELRKAAPDGYTLFVGDAGSLAANPLLYTNLPYDVGSDVAPISTLFHATFMVFTRRDGRFATLDELLRAAKAMPGRVSYASLGNGHPSQLAVETFARAAGVEFLHVPFRDAGQMIAAVTNGDVDFTTLSMNTSSGMVKAGKWHPLAVAATARLPEYPEIPTIAEAGGPAVVMTPWAALVGVAGTPAAVLDAIRQTTLAALSDRTVRDRVEAQGFTVLGGTPDELAALIRHDATRYEPLVRSGRVRAE